MTMKACIQAGLVVLMCVTAHGAASAATIHVNILGPYTGKKTDCSIVDAIQAATTNKAVHGCAAGATSSDTISLDATGTYQGYKVPLHVSTSGGALTISGKGVNNSVIHAANYGYPSPDPLTNSDGCSYPAALMSGGTLTLQNLTIESDGTGGTTGICQHAGSLTLNTVYVGGSGAPSFTEGGIRSWPNGPVSGSGSNIHRSLTLSNSVVIGNTSDDCGGGIAAYGNVDLHVGSNTFIESNLSNQCAGGIIWEGGWSKMGTFLIDGGSYVYNNATSGSGGGIFFYIDDPKASVSLNGANVLDNAAGYNTDSIGEGGGIYVDLAANKQIHLTSSAFSDNSALDQPQCTFNTNGNAAYNAIYCSKSTFSGTLWTGWPTPQLQGDGTCQFLP